MRRIADASWRRRYLFLTPVLVMLPLSVAAAFLLPRSFETSALLLLQESGRNNPLAGEPVSAESMQQKVPGLEALLKSEQVLAPAIRGMEAAGSRKPETDLQGPIRNLRSALSVELIGTDFLAIRLKGSSSEGLGRDLSIVLSSFLEALLSEPRGSAAQIVLKKQQQQIASLQEKRTALQQQVAVNTSRSTSPESSSGGNDVLPDLRRQLVQLELQLLSARETFDGLTKRYPPTNAGIGPGILNAPGRIKIVDPPQDPNTSTTSRSKLLLGGIAAGFLLGIALAWAAELLDSKIYDRDELVSATGLPLLAVLIRTPRMAVSASPGAIPSRRKSPARLVLLIVAAAVLIGVVFVLAFKVPMRFQLPTWLTYSSTGSTSKVTSLVP